ncbi:MAG: ATP-binding protein [Thermodesulfobacteriota bacterium]
MTIVLLGCLWGCTLAHGTDTHPSRGTTKKEIRQVPEIEVYEDKTGSETIESVQSRQFHPSARAVPSFGHTQSVYWFKLSKTNPDPEPRTFYLKVQNQWLDSIDFFVKSEASVGFQRYRAGALVPFEDRVSGEHGPDLRLQFAPHDTKTIFIRVASRSAVRVPLSFLSEEASQRARRDTLFVLGMFYGIMGFLLLYNVFAWSILKQRAYIYYILLLVFVCIFQLGWDDLTPHVSVLSHPETLSHACSGAFALVCMCNILFVGSFMHVRQKYPILYRIMDILVLAAVVVAVLYVVAYYWGNYLMLIYAPVFATALTLTIGLMWYLGEPHARYLLLGHAVFPVIATVVAAVLVGTLPFHHLVLQLAKLAYVWQGVFFSLALADRFATMQRDFRQTLEITVAERSAKLLTANRDLEGEIAERKRTEEALRLATEAAEAGARAKSEFLANMSHEIRTPLNAIAGMTGLLLDSGLTKPQRDRAQIVRSAADTLLVVVNDVLDFSKIEAGRLDLEEVDFDLRSAMQCVESLLGAKATGRNLRLSHAVSDNLPLFLRGDPNRLRQILLNLGNNALKFTDEGRISLAADLRQVLPDQVVIHFSVADTGIGIPEDKLPMIFHRFSQVDSSITRKYGGTGLGLAISSQLARAMGGEMWAESEPGKGSTFHFTARFGLGRAEEAMEVGAVPETPSDLDLTGMHVLLVEDNVFNQAVAVELLTRQGCFVQVASNGREAVEAFDAERFDLILMDLQMPEVDGFEATRMIRARETSGRIPIIAQTAHAFAEDRDRCLQAGMDEHISKPIRTRELLEVLARFAPEATRGRRSGYRIRKASPQVARPAADHEVFDLEALRQRVGEDEETLSEVIRLFSSHTPTLVAEVRSAAQAENWRLLRTLAHTLKGGAATFGAMRLAELADCIERATQEPQTNSLEPLLSQLDIELRTLHECLEKLGYGQEGASSRPYS